MLQFVDWKATQCSARDGPACRASCGRDAVIAGRRSLHRAGCLDGRRVRQEDAAEYRDRGSLCEGVAEHGDGGEDALDHGDGT